MDRRSRRLIRVERYIMRELLLIMAALTVMAFGPLALLIAGY
ncbi:hypothetical protein [Rhizobium leucaenae]|jgi:hypothetical protein|uniref:Uncharacterized protein n=1 Tax=Rhizobium leucaenae TaxID=29450 RepID=A0A7W6ZYT3_9HYPH|nr:hypothetical protein [Rhizobium leucaenae]MBB4570655.1 hypothetical protein [Rhizobium leucaenae]MBB6304024.1 hypothetical protein [Rhizobium leucaenae]